MRRRGQDARDTKRFDIISNLLMGRSKRPLDHQVNSLTLYRLSYLGNLSEQECVLITLKLFFFKEDCSTHFTYFNMAHKFSKILNKNGCKESDSF